MATGEIRVLTDLESMHDTLAVQEAAWGFSDIEKVPSRLMLVSAKAGGLVLGCYDGERLVGFSYAVCGRGPAGEAYLHSHMTALLPDYQGKGIGYELKMRQRQEALDLGYKLIEWTFDPLEARNAHFNIEKLGVICRRYEPNLYGITTSRLHGGLPTDRLVAEWFLDQPRFEGGIDAEIEVPPGRSAKVQLEVRERFTESFARGLVVVGHRRQGESGSYLLAST